MRATVARLREELGIGSLLGWLIVIGMIVLVPLAVAFAARTDRLLLFAAASAFGLVLLVSVRWPLLPLYAFAALIPIEAVLVIENLGTLSKFAGLLFVVAYGGPRLGRLALGAMPPPAWAYVAWAILSLGWALDPAVAWDELSTLLQLFVIGLLIADVVIHRPAVVRPILWAYSIAAAITGLLGIESFVGSGGAFGGRAAGLQNQDPAQFAVVLLPALVFGLFEILNGRRLWLSIPVTLFTLGGVVVSGTRGAWLAVAVVVFLFVLPQLTMAKRAAAITVMVTMVLVTLQLPGVGEMVTQRADTALSSGGAGRSDIWSVASNIYAEAPVLGVGYANFPVAYTADIVRESDVGLYSVNNPQGRGSHSILIGTTIELGPIGMLLVLLFLGPLVLRRGWGPDAVVVQACLASLMTSALFLDILSNRKQVWLVIGLAAGLAYLARRRAGRTVEVDAGQRPTGPARRGARLPHARPVPTPPAPWPEQPADRGSTA